MSRLKHILYPKNVDGRDFIVGDLHGCRVEFDKLLEFVNFDKTKDRCFSVGDLIDRGQDSVGCLQLLYENWFHAVRGNHEQMMIDTIVHKMDKYGWIINGGNWHQFEDMDLMEQLAHKANELPYIITIDGICNIVHAELIVNANRQYVTQEDIEKFNFTELDETAMIWCRNLSEGYLFSEEPDILPVVCGHTPMELPSLYESHFNIDTGAVYKNSLTLIQAIDTGVFSIFKHDMKTGESSKSYEVNQ